MRTRAEIVNPCIGFLYSPYPGPSVDLRKNRTPDIKPFEKPDPKYRTSIRKSRPDSFFLRQTILLLRILSILPLRVEIFQAKVLLNLESLSLVSQSSFSLASIRLRNTDTQIQFLKTKNYRRIILSIIVVVDTIVEVILDTTPCQGKFVVP